jgi:hypothetical protein
VSAESAVTEFLPLGALLEERELIISDPVLTSNGYNKRYYIGRTLHQQKAIKKEISSDKNIEEKRVFLANTEQEFKQLYQEHPNSNVHWLEKDKSGKLVWQQSPGSLATLRKHFDTENPDTYSPDNLDKLLQQAQHQSVMLISDTAGMGKSTVLTHLSMQIKQTFPEKWVLRIDLNGHTDALKALKQEQIIKEKKVKEKHIDKKKAMEFVWEKVLKLKSRLKMELFKQCCEQKQKVGIVIMLDGVDEISPFYKDTVIDLLQALRQTAVEQLWVTTRPHLGNELEDKLQQLSYTLEPFSEENQVEFLTIFWSLNHWLTEREGKEREVKKDKLEICAKHLLNNLTQSITDKDRQFTGIPLQTRMLAEAFEEEVKKSYHSAESMPKLEFQIDLLGLYERFTERKYDIFQKEKCQVKTSNVTAIEKRESDLKGMRVDHQLMALKMLFTEEQVKLIQSNRECTFSAEELTRIGIVQVSHDGKPHFIHSTFAEYYVADCLANCLTEGNNTSEKELTFILKDVFQKEDYRVVRVFIDELLTGSEISKQVLKEYGNQILGIRKESHYAYELYVYESSGNSLPLLHTAVRECNTNIIGFLLDCAQTAKDTDRDMVKKLLLSQDEQGHTAWHHAVFSRNMQVSEKLCECAKRNHVAQELRREVFFPKTVGKGMPGTWQ